VTLSRTAALSRQLSLFFKYHINQILEESEEVLPGDKPQNGRRATIVYSGGDDLFIVGAWSDVVELALDLKHAFAKYTESTLTISAGIGLYQDSYPISVIAEEVGAMVDRSKDLPGKNAITILENGLTHEETNQGKKVRVSNGTYSWKTFEERVLADKLSILTQFMETTGTYGNSFLYHLLELIRRQDDKINFARYVYLLSRMEPDEKAPQEEKDRYQEFSNHMVMWVRTGEDRRELESAIELYVYLHRDEEGQAE
jgi:CRISPR-associated protein Csm1